MALAIGGQQCNQLVDEAVSPIPGWRRPQNGRAVVPLIDIYPHGELVGSIGAPDPVIGRIHRGILLWPAASGEAEDASSRARNRQERFRRTIGLLDFLRRSTRAPYRASISSRTFRASSRAV